MCTEDKHMLGEPAFFGGPVDGQSQGQFLQAYRVAAILGIDAINNVILEVDINPALIDILAHGIFKLAFGVDESEKIAR